MKSLQNLYKWLHQYNLHKEAQAVKELTEYEEPWHEEAVQEFGDAPVSEEEYIDKNFAPPDEAYLTYGHNRNPDVYKQIFQRENFHTVSLSEKPIIAGEGGFGAVFRGVYQGKQAVAKVALGSSEDFHEVNKWKAVLEASTKLPPNMRKHIPNIYYVNQDYLTVGNREIDYQIIIMEELLPLSNHLKSIITRVRDESEQNLNKLLKDENFLYKLAQIILKHLHNYPEMKKWKKLRAITPQEIFQFLYSLGPLDYNSDNMISARLSEYLQEKYQLAPLMTRNFRSAISNALTNTFQLESIPYSVGESLQTSTRYTPYWENIPETKTFLETLKTLSGSFGIDWNDLKFSNMMMDREGNLKIIDVGVYDLRDMVR